MRCSLLLLALLGCAESPSPPADEPVPSPPLSTRVAATETETETSSATRLTDLDVVIDQGQCAAPAPEGPLAAGPFRYAGTTRAGMHRWIAPLPYRPRGLFFQDAPAGLELADAEGPLAFDRFGLHDRATWSHDHRSLYVYTPSEAAPTGLHLTWPDAETREFDRRQAGVGKAFVDGTTHEGIGLACGSTASMTVRVPDQAAELSFTPVLVPPEILAGEVPSDAQLEVRIGEGPQAVPLATLRVGEHHGRVHLDLSEHAGQEVTLAFRGDTAGAVFLSGPVVHTRQASPPRVVFVFVDTLRADHVTQLGYERDTTAPLQPFFDDAAVFTQARTIAPWTLPSARTTLTGRMPEAWDVAPTLAERLGESGWSSGFFAGNLYLSAQLGLDRGFDLHKVTLWPGADEVTSDALAFLDAHDGEPVFLQVHYMDAHLPYVEPPSHRTRYAAADVPDGLREQFHVSDVRGAGVLDDDAIQWIRDRYDNNIRFTADHVARLLEALDDDDIVVFYSDHGEEFFEHNAFEHGHSLLDELLHVPLAIRAPGLAAGPVDAPVSLLDVTPTVLDLLGRPAEGLDGTSLGPVASGDADAAAALEARHVAIGRTLYGTPMWGLLHEHQKWIMVDGREAVFDLATDPGETTPLPPVGDTWRRELAGALERPVVEGWRWEVSRAKPGPNPPHEALCTVPGGFRDVVVADDPLGKHQATARRVDDAEAARILEHWEAPEHRRPDGAGHVFLAFDGHGPEVVAAPVLPMAEVGHEAQCTVRWCVRHPKANRECPRTTLSIEPARPAGFDDVARTPLARGMWSRQRQFLWGLGIAPVLGTDADHRPDELRDALEAIGYTED